MAKAGWWWFAFAWTFLGLLAVSANAFDRSAADLARIQTQTAPERPPSNCLAIAEALPRATYVNLTPVEGGVPVGTVRIEYVGHSTFWIESPGGVTIATDFAGWTGNRGTPRVVTMNKAHETHYTDNPDPAIEHVLRGWNPEGGAAQHNVEIGDVLFRNVTTDIRAWGVPEKDGNSIFIFEVANLCIGHLGHLHHKPTPEQLGKIGRLDILFVPVDGGFTLNLPEMMEVVRKLRTSLVIPMHFFGGMSLQRFIDGLKDSFQIEIQKEPVTVVSLQTLPRRPTVRVLPGY
jgi:L-ascorbate metabolism protein UlaG (beta-lactamase superfamily)